MCNSPGPPTPQWRDDHPPKSKTIIIFFALKYSNIQSAQLEAHYVDVHYYTFECWIEPKYNEL